MKLCLHQNKDLVYYALPGNLTIFGHLPTPVPVIPGPSALGPASPSSRVPSTTGALWNPSVFAPSPA